MTETGSTCPHCQAVAGSDARFCGECGRALEASVAPKRSLNQTVLGLDAEAVRTATAALRDQALAAAAAASKEAPAGSMAQPAAAEPSLAPAADATPAFGSGASAVSAELLSAARPFAQTRLGAPAPNPTTGMVQPTAASHRDSLPRGVTPLPPARASLAPAAFATASGAFGAAPSAGANGSLPEDIDTAAQSGAHIRADADALGSIDTGAASERASVPPSARSSVPPTAAFGAGAKPGLGSSTLLGLVSPDMQLARPAAPGDSPAAPAGPAEVANFHATRTDAGTMLGMSPPLPAAEPTPAQFGTTRAGGTMLGMNGPLGGQITPAAVPSHAPDRGGHGRTMLGVPMAPIASQPAPSSSSLSLGEPPQSRLSTFSLPPPAARAQTRPVWIWLVVGLALLALVAMLVVRLTSRPSAPEVTARIVAADGGESLLFEVPGAPQGSRLRFGGQEQELAAGRASFPLAADSLRVGDNIVLADVIKPNGETSSARITLAVFYRIWVDTSALHADRSAIDVVVTALPGTNVTLEGEALALDAQGRGTRSFPLDLTRNVKAGAIDHVVRYRMQPPAGETVVDELHTRIPLALMQIDRPGPDVVTDRETLEIAGAVGRGEQVSVDGVNVPVRDGRFLYKLPLPKPGEYKPRVVASAPGKAPLGVTLEIRRVHDLTQAAREFQVDGSLSYAKLASNPTHYRGQAIAIEGRVYAYDAHAGSSVIQMLARPCPSSQRCSVWVVDPQATEVEVDKFVRVLGTVDGEQQFRSEKNEIVTVPKIAARFVLPAKP